MMKSIWKKAAALFCAAATAVQGMAVMPVSALEPDKVEVLVLGDDTLVSDSDDSAVQYIANYLNGTATNRAEIGTKATELLEELQTDTSLQADVAKADVILLSVGMNDLVFPMLYENTDIFDASQYATLEALANSITQGQATRLDARLSITMPGIVSETNAAITAVADEIYKQNSGADLIVQTVTNPLAVEFSKMNVSTNRLSAIRTLYDYLDVCMQGGQTSNGVTISTGVNQTIAALPHVRVSDFYLPFVGAPGEKSMGFYLTDIANLNMTFNPLGQVVIAASAIEAGGLTNGIGNVISEAYAASGTDLSTLRPAMDTVIQAASAHTATTYEIGDLDADSQVTMDDAFAVLQEYSLRAAGRFGEMQPAQRRAADADGDGKVTMDDAFLFLQYYALRAAGHDTDLTEFLQQNGRA